MHKSNTIFCISKRIILASYRTVDVGKKRCNCVVRFKVMSPIGGYR